MVAKKRTQAKMKKAGSGGSKSLKKKPSKSKKTVSSKASRKAPAPSGSGKSSKSKSLKKKVPKSKAPTSKKTAQNKVRRSPTTRASTPRRKPTPKKTAAKKRTSSPKKAAKGHDARPPRPSTFKAAVKLYESGVKFMHSRNFAKSKAKFRELIKQYPGEIELLDRANVLIQAADKRIQESRRNPKPTTAEEYYQFGVADLNRRELETALDYLLRALKLLPKADHVLYALAATSAVRGERDEAVDYLKKAIQYRDENRFLADNDSDFESISDDPEFIKLIKSSPE